MKSKLIYSLPVRKENFNLAISDPKVHTGKVFHAVDFDLPVGTPILASQKGKVVEIYTESNEGGFELKYVKDVNKFTNRITIKHADNEYSQYAHLAFKSERVKVGQEVECGDVIALSGNTGYSSQPHLHFHVMQLLNFGKDWESIEIRWDTIFNVLGKNQNLNQTNKTKNFWSNGIAAKLYRKFAGRKFRKMHEKIGEQIVGLNPKDVLDIACGPGDFLLHLSNLSQAINLYGTDIAPGMVEYATKKLSGKAKILESNGEKQPFPESSFDVITIMMAFHHFPKKIEALEGIKNLLREKGVLIIVDVVAKSNFQKKLWNVLEKIVSVRGYVGHYTKDDIEDMAKQCGFIFSTNHISGMSKRYLICKFIKQ